MWGPPTHPLPAAPRLRGNGTVGAVGAQLVDLSHRITHGMVTYPGLPTPSIGTHLSREAAEGIYGPGITFHIGLITMCTNTGTYLDVPSMFNESIPTQATFAATRTSAEPADRCGWCSR